MKLLRDMKMAYKLVSFFLLMALLLGGVGSVGYYTSQEISGNMQVMYHERIVPMHLMDTCRSQIHEVEALSMQLLLAPVNQSDENNLMLRASERLTVIDNLLHTFEERPLDNQERIWLDQLRQELASYQEERAQALALLTAGRHQEAFEHYQNYGAVHLDNADALLRVLSDHVTGVAAIQSRQGEQTAFLSAVTIIAISSLAVLLALLSGMSLNRLITKPLKSMLTEVEKVAAGDLSGLESQVPAKTKDEIGKLAIGFNQMARSLNEYLKQLEAKNREIHYQAYHDSLTELANRRKFQDRLQDLLKNEALRVMAILFIDLDRFKDINDTMGHSTGDMLLKAVARRLIHCLPGADTVARLGGDEFTVILVEPRDNCVIEKVCESVMQSIAHPFVLKGHEYYIAASIGISLYPVDGDNAETLVRAADTAMYQAKQKGRNNYQFFTSCMHDAIANRLTLEKYLRKAVELNEMELFYQPKVCLETGRIMGMEALLRWNHPKLKLISPTEFIPIAEETGMILALGEWALVEACRQTKSWQEAGLPFLRVAVNLSPNQFHQPDLPEQIRWILEDTGLDPQWLELEITENILMDKTADTLNTLQQLKSIGVCISLDDFGTGYSSFSYLKGFPIDCLKIDRTFIQDIPRSPKDANIASAMIRLARNLNMIVVAEGVETKEQLAFLQNHQCHVAQGYIFSEPLSVSAFENLIEKGRYRLVKALKEEGQKGGYS
ncbi:EAL domain-containing protein [Heliobacillus mobilis]|uniref:EAL domain-containing protein n=1 Tax=Heliobacterium mobile TaxID=28064 RepID=A0A6I3SM05_HELMO|nr:EAL domain-containing protein [Heliobacterium mobile]MTV49991.1 EAL domain-containing protein [Heliobacterium mobile]